LAIHPQRMEQEESKSHSAGMICGGYLFIGMGIGFAMGRMVPGLIIGLGVGLVAMAVLLLRAKGKAVRQATLVLTARSWLHA
jgi:hypothetical protein